MLVGAFNQEKALVGAFSVILKPMKHYTAQQCSPLPLPVGVAITVLGGGGGVLGVEGVDMAAPGRLLSPWRYVTWGQCLLFRFLLKVTNVAVNHARTVCLCIA